MVARSSGYTKASPVPTIRDLIREALAAGRSVRDLEADSGFQVKFQTFQELSNAAPKQFPKKLETINGMARALHATESAIVLAYASGLGVPVTSRSDFALRLPAGVDDLDEPMKRALISVVRAALATGEENAMDATEAEGTPSTPRESEKTPNNVHTLTPKNPGVDVDDDAAEPLRGAARDPGTPSRGRQVRDRQTTEGETPDPEGPEGGA